MKKVNKKGLVLVVMFATMVSYANEFTCLIKEKNSKVTNFTIENVVEGSMLLIKDSNGLILYKELIEQSGEYSKGFDLTSLPDGEYYFEVDKDVDLRIIPFKVIANKVEFNKDEEFKVFKPTVFLKGDYVYISKSTFSDQELQVKIYHKGNDIVLTEKINEQSLGRIYNFSTSEKGTYRIVLKSDGRKFIKNVSI